MPSTGSRRRAARGRVFFARKATFPLILPVRRTTMLGRRPAHSTLRRNKPAMKNTKPLRTLCAVAWGVLGWAGLAAAEAPEAPAAGALVITDSAGKEHTLKNWKVLHGTRRLSWLAEGTADKGGKKSDPLPTPKLPAGPEALELREENSTPFENGIVTLVPLDRIRAIDFDNDKQTVAVHVWQGQKAEGDLILTGSTRFKNHNKLVIEAKVDKGELGVAEIRFQGGIPRGIRGVHFPTPQPGPAAAAGRPAVVTATDKEKSTHPVTDLQPLYQTPAAGPRLVPTLLFKKTLKLDLAKIQALQLAETDDSAGTSFTVTLKDGAGGNADAAVERHGGRETRPPAGLRGPRPRRLPLVPDPHRRGHPLRRRQGRSGAHAARGPVKVRGGDPS